MNMSMVCLQAVAVTTHWLELLRKELLSQAMPAVVTAGASCCVTALAGAIALALV